jgi:hypothetical protein
LLRQKETNPVALVWMISGSHGCQCLTWMHFCCILNEAQHCTRFKGRTTDSCWGPKVTCQGMRLQGRKQ